MIGDPMPPDSAPANITANQMRPAADQNVARRELSLLNLAQELGNEPKACRVMGYSRQQFLRDPPQF
jgi:hypothetical protein